MAEHPGDDARPPEDSEVEDDDQLELDVAHEDDEYDYDEDDDYDEEELPEELQQLQQLVDTLNELDDRLESSELEPDRERDAWPGLRDDVTDLRRTYEDGVLASFDQVVAVLEEETRGSIGGAAGSVGGQIAAVVFASGDRFAAADLLRKAAKLAPAGELREELEEGAREPDHYTLLCHGRWLLRQGVFDLADPIFKQLKAETSLPALRRGADQGLRSPRPISGAPSLWSFNGILGVGLYGNRDPHEDSVVKTTCFNVLGIPLIPISAFRVIPAGDEEYYFLAKERLSPFAKWWRVALVLGVAAAIGFVYLQSYLNAPSRLAGIALEEAEEVQRSGDAEAAEAAYQELINRYAGEELTDATIRTAGEKLLGIVCDGTPDPPDVDKAGRIVKRLDELPGDAAEGGAPVVIERLSSWAGSLGKNGDDESVRGAIRLLDMAREIAPPGKKGPFREQIAGYRRSLALKLRDEWPLQALELFVQAHADPQALVDAGELLRSFGDGPSLWIAAQDTVERFLSHAEFKSSLKEVHAYAAERFRQARRAMADPARKQALESGDPAALQAALANTPGDQELVVALAQLKQGQGDVKGAIAMVEGLAKPGLLIPKAKRVLASLYSEEGRLVDADELLTRYLGGALPRYQSARKAYEARAKAIQDRWIEAARSGDLPSNIDSRLVAAPESEQPEMFSRWVAEQMDDDEELTKLRRMYERNAEVVPASLTLGMVKLRRANEVTGDARQQLLNEAERVFLAIRQDAEGLPTYHLGLGQVYHRLGRREEGDAEFSGLLERNDPDLSLAVGRAYRELGLVPRAREVAQKVFQEGPDDKAKANAALLMSLMADDLEEKEKWLSRSDKSSAFVKTNLLEMKARRLQMEGKLEEADELFAQAADAYAKDAQHSSASANNTALALLSRYSCTGDERHLQEAVRYLEAALRLEPDNALVVGNLADLCEFAGTIRVLGKWLETAELRLDSQDAGKLLDTLLYGPLRAKVIAAMRAEPLFRRAGELSRQEAVLAPQLWSPYFREATLYRRTADAERLRALVGRAAAASIDTSQREAARAEYVSGTKDEQLLASLNGELSYLAELAQAHEKKRGATAAAVHTLAGMAFGRRAAVTGKAEDAATAVNALEQASDMWAKGGAKRHLARTLVMSAVLEAKGSSPELEKAWSSDGRQYGLEVLVHRALTGDSADAIRAALGRTKQLGEAVKLSRTLAAERPRLSDWVLGRLAGDAELEKLGVKVFDNQLERVDAELTAKLEPRSENATLTWKLFESKGVGDN